MYHRKLRPWLYLIFFLFCYVYLWRVVHPHIIYHGFGTVVPNVPLFSTGWQFLRDSLMLPGGMVVYLYGFLSQWYYYPWLGALLIVLVAICLTELSRQHYVYAGLSGSTGLTFVPAIIILLAYNQYDHPLAACLTTGAGLLCSYIWERLPLCRKLTRLGVFFLMVGMSYWLAGAGGAFVFSLMTAAYLLCLRRDWLSAVLTLPAAIAVIGALADYGFHLSPKQAFLILTPFSQDLTTNMQPLSQVLVVLLYTFVPMAVFLLCLWRTGLGRSRQAAVHAQKKQNKKAGPLVWRDWTSGRYFTKHLIPVIPGVVLAVGLYASYNNIHRQIVLMNCLARQRQWAEVLKLADRLPRNIHNIYCNHDINRALYHTGKLGADMFCYPQNHHALLLTHEQEESFITQLKMFDVFLEMGNVDYAEKLACEFAVDKGNIGFVLEKLAWINLVKEQQGTAQIYLNALKKDLIYRHSAEAILSGLKTGFGPDEATYLRQIRSYRRSNREGRLQKESIEEMLTGLIEHNPRNKMAFEYLMACYLLSGQLKKIAGYAGHFSGLGYQDVPPLYEEAVLLYHASRSQRLNLNALKLKRKTFERYRRFIELCNSLPGHNRPVVLQQLIREFGTSYFFYYEFNVSRPMQQAR